jgi:hypothetical protein
MRRLFAAVVVIGFANAWLTRLLQRHLLLVGHLRLHSLTVTWPAPL